MSIIHSHYQNFQLDHESHELPDSIVLLSLDSAVMLPKPDFCDFCNEGHSHQTQGKFCCQDNILGEPFLSNDKIDILKLLLGEGYSQNLTRSQDLTRT